MLIAQARKMDVGTVYSTTVGVILYVVRLVARIESAIVLLLELDAGNCPYMPHVPLRDVRLRPETRSTLAAGLTTLESKLRTGKNCIQAMLEAWCLECFTKI